MLCKINKQNKTKKQKQNKKINKMLVVLFIFYARIFYTLNFPSSFYFENFSSFYV
jgi:membrane protein insertase Oxa1/YidC/SpoIIIJ